MLYTLSAHIHNLSALIFLDTLTLSLSSWDTHPFCYICTRLNWDLKPMVWKIILRSSPLMYTYFAPSMKKGLFYSVQFLFIYKADCPTKRWKGPWETCISRSSSGSLGRVHLLPSSPLAELKKGLARIESIVQFLLIDKVNLGQVISGRWSVENC